MSYILDALRKADAERERDPARGIHAQPAALQPRGLASGTAWPWVAGGAGLIIAAAAVFWRFGAGAGPAPAVPPAAPVAAAAPTPATPLTPPAPPAPPAPLPVVPAAEVQPAAPPMPAPATPTPVKSASSAALAVPAAAASGAPAASAAPAATRAAPQVPTAPQVAASSPPAAAAERIVAYADLPPDVQRDLPKIVINGGVHSDNAAQRLLIVGGQVMQEGAEIAPGLVLEQIRPKAAVLRFRGLRYSVPY